MEEKLLSTKIEKYGTQIETPRQEDKSVNEHPSIASETFSEKDISPYIAEFLAPEDKENFRKINKNNYQKIGLLINLKTLEKELIQKLILQALKIVSPSEEKQRPKSNTDLEEAARNVLTQNTEESFQHFVLKLGDIQIFREDISLSSINTSIQALIEAFKGKYQEAENKNDILIRRAKLNSRQAQNLISNASDWSCLPEKEKTVRVALGFFSKFKGGSKGMRCGLALWMIALMFLMAGILLGLALMIPFCLPAGIFFFGNPGMSGWGFYFLFVTLFLCCTLKEADKEMIVIVGSLCVSLIFCMVGAFVLPSLSAALGWDAIVAFQCFLVVMMSLTLIFFWIIGSFAFRENSNVLEKFVDMLLAPIYLIIITFQLVLAGWRLGNERLKVDFECLSSYLELFSVRNIFRRDFWQRTLDKLITSVDTLTVAEMAGLSSGTLQSNQLHTPQAEPDIDLFIGQEFGFATNVEGFHLLKGVQFAAPILEEFDVVKECKSTIVDFNSPSDSDLPSSLVQGSNSHFAGMNSNAFSFGKQEQSAPLPSSRITDSMP